MPLERIQNLIIALLLGLLLISLWSGYHVGHNRAITSTVVHNSEALSQGVAFFYKDQDRYPTFLEFQNQQLMLAYAQPFPVSMLTTKHCPQNFVYQNPSQKQYSILFCVPQALGSYAKGWNKVGASK